MSKKTYSSFPEQQILQEGFRDFLKRGAQMLSPGASGMYKRGGGKKQGNQTILDPVPPDPTPDPTPTPPKPAPKSGGDYMTISGTEFATMNFLVKGELLQIIRDAAMVGVAAKDAASRNLQQLFNKEFFPALIKMTKNPNIDIAEGIDMDEFLQEMLIEAYGPSDASRQPLTRRQQAAKKGQARERGGMQRYLRTAGGKPPIIANKIARALTKALTKNANPDSLLDAAAEVSSTIKDPKARAQYEKRYENSLMKDPAGRVKNYKQNVAAFVGSVTDLATKAATKALAAGTDFAADKAANTAAARTPASASDAPAAPSRPEEPVRRRGSASSRALDRVRARASRGRSSNLGRGTMTEEDTKTYKITSEGKVERVVNEEE
jgi:hypothetical protein